MSGRFGELLGSTPPATLGFVGLCVFVYALQLVMDLDVQRFTMCPRLVLYVHEYYRIITSALFHGSLMHIGMNMLSTFHLSTMLEKRLGTIPHMISTLWTVLLTSAVYLIVAWVASFGFGYDEWMYQHSVGFSGVLFHLCVLECNLTSNASRSLFGVLSVPAYLYPWTLLVLLQMFMPNLSFLGHLSGIATGTLQYYGLLDFMTVGLDVEHWNAMSWLVRLPSFASAPIDNTRIFQEPSSLLHSIRNGGMASLKLVSNLLDALFVCICGRGHGLNSNIRLPSWYSAFSASEGHVLGCTLTVEDDNEWNGLPTSTDLEKQPLTSHIV